MGRYAAVDIDDDEQRDRETETVAAGTVSGVLRVTLHIICKDLLSFSQAIQRSSGSARHFTDIHLAYVSACSQSLDTSVTNRCACYLYSIRFKQDRKFLSIQCSPVDALTGPIPRLQPRICLFEMRVSEETSVSR